MPGPDWNEAHVRRLFWRAGFGATSEEATLWAERGRAATLDWMVNGGPGPAFKGPEPHVEGGAPLDVYNEWGHDRLWWLDRMVRSQRPLIEKMTLFWHDHFATADQSRGEMMAQNRMLRKYALGNFRKMLRAVTKDKAMQQFLSLVDSYKDAPNENYAREVMELFGLGRGYTEKDIREAARALTGFRGVWGNDGLERIFFERERHDYGVKKILGKRGRHDWRDVIDIVCRNRNHAPFLVEKLWSFFITEPLDGATKKRLVRVYKRGGLRVKPLVAAILDHPALYERLDRPDMIKSPVVFVAGNLRTLGAGITRDDWVWLMDGMGQSLFDPPSVAGWDWGPAWLGTNAIRARFNSVNYLFNKDDGPLYVPRDSVPTDLSPRQALDRALAATGRPWISAETETALLRMGETIFSDVRPPPKDEWKRRERSDMRERIYRHFLLSGPDAQLH